MTPDTAPNGDQDRITDSAARWAWRWFVGLAVLLVLVTVAAVVVATLTGHYEPIIGAGIALVLFGPILWGLTR